MTAHFMVVGNPITHSKSPEIHQKFAQQTGLNIQYNKQFCPNDQESFIAVINAFFNGGGVGANITVPFKEMAFDLCQNGSSDLQLQHAGVTLEAQMAGAVNTLYLKDNKLCGHNTDGLGLVNHINQLGWSLKNKKVAIIGAGGAAKGIILPLFTAGVDSICIANRTLHKAENLIRHYLSEIKNLDTQQISEIKSDLQCCQIEQLAGSFDLIINATSIGLSDNKLPLNKELSCQYAYDMMYGKTLLFLQHFANQGTETSDGYGMLLGQAALSFEMWTNQPVDLNLLN